MGPSWMSPNGAFRAITDLPGAAAGAVLDRGAGTDLDAVLDSEAARAAFAGLAEETGRGPDVVRADARRCLEEMVATHASWAHDTWRGMGRWLLRAYDLEIDHRRLDQLRRLDEGHPLVWLPSHRSYLDA